MASRVHRLVKLPHMDCTIASSSESEDDGGLGDGPVSTAKYTVGDYGYFECYSNYRIHELMIKDQVRTGTYRRAIIDHKYLIKGKVVLDIGCGTGILSLFAAQAGAKKVIGIDCSGMAYYAKKVVKMNGFADIITIVQAKVEDLEELPDGIKKVDVIISEWMGYSLLYESMIDTVIYARDRWLARGGILLPDKCSLYITAIQDSVMKDKRLNVWDKFHGFDMSALKPLIIRKAFVDGVDEEQVVTDHCLLTEVDLNTVVKAEDLIFRTQFHLTCQRQDFVHGFATFFIVEFSQCFRPVWFSTAPEAPRTHWKQTTFHLNGVIAAKEGETITGEFAMAKDFPTFRELRIKIKVDFDGSERELHEENKYKI